MLIRSQNRTILLNLSKAEALVITDNEEEIVALIETTVAKGSNLLTMGKYTSPEKCYAVLDMIEKAYKAEGVSIGQIATYQDVFQMPQDEEVANGK